MTAPLTADECYEIQLKLDPNDWPMDGLDPNDWNDIMAAVSRLAEMGMVWQFNSRLANAPADSGCYVAATIETWGRAILETVRAAKAQEE